MTISTLIYAADKDGKFIDPKTGECWNIPEDREFFRETIKGKSIICGRKTFEQDWRGLEGAGKITVLTRQRWPSAVLENLPKDERYKTPHYGIANDVLSAMRNASVMGARGEKLEEIYCIGGKQTLEAVAPFASRVLLTRIGGGEFWLPPFIKKEWDMESCYDENGKESNDAESLWWLMAARPRADDGSWERYDIRRFQPIEF